MKRWLTEATLPQPEIAFAGNETIAENQAHDRIMLVAFGKRAIRVDEYIFDVIGVAQQIGVTMGFNAKANDWTIPVGGVADEGERIASETGDISDEWECPRTRYG